MDPTDPWTIQPRERARYEEQFRSLNPINGMVTGDQAKGFFLQSQLPPAVLAEIWSLSDADSDGKMDINEFSIACKLINLKLRGFPVPNSLPPSMKALLNSLPIQNVVNTAAVQQQLPPQAIAVVPPQPLVMPVTSVPLVPVQPISTTPQMMAARQSLTGNTLIQAVPPAIPPQPNLASRHSLTGNSLIQAPPQVNMATRHSIAGHSLIQTSPPSIPPQPNMAARQSLTGNSLIQQPIPPPVIPPQPNMAARQSLTGNTLIQAGPPAPLLANEPLIQQVPLSSQSRSGSLTSSTLLQGAPPSYISGVPQQVAPQLPRAPSLESPPPALTSPLIEWGVPHQSKLKYTQLFNTTDRARSGFLSGPQARNIMVQTGLPQTILAQIWNLADADTDGKLSCEEFVLALHLCDMAKEGRSLPATLTPDLIPPTMRRQRGNSISTDDKQEPSFILQNSASFEDRRKENFDKGQAELDRRRAVLLEAQRKEQEERERKEREEQEKLERMRAEQEARRQEELQKQLQRQRELEQEQEEQRRRALEQKEAARKELERQRQQEWEKTRQQELEAQRMREQESVLKLKAKNQSLAIELSSLTDKVKELSSKISETRNGVSGVKATIDGMRSTRDSHLSEMSAIKSKLKEQNQRLLLLSQEKARLDARNKVAAASDAAATEQVKLAFTNKQITIKHLTEKLQELKQEVELKQADAENNTAQLNEMKTQLKNLVNDCETLYETYADKRDQILQMKSATSGSWGAPSWNAADSWTTPPAAESWSTPAATVAPPPATASDGYQRYRALYEFQSRNPDELSFQPGDIIMVPLTQNAEPGWLAGELRGATGWFPESYVELIDQASEIDTPAAATVSVSSIGDTTKQPLEGILEVPESTAEIKTDQDGLNEFYIAVYPYQSQEPGDLSFELNDKILVTKKEGDWWTGTIGLRSGIFPSNYVQKYDESLAVTPAADDASGADDVFAQDSTPTTTVPAGTALNSGLITATNESSKSPLPGSTCVSGRATPADFDYTKPATPDFSAIPAAQTKVGKKGEIATVIAPYQATSSEQLSLARGQLVCIRKKTTTGWWEGELQSKGKKKQVGWFPASYVKMMISRRLSQTTPDLEAEQMPEKVKALFPYKAMNDDELTFEKDDVISVLAKEEAAWWRGELNGTTGLFPSNYVMPVDNPFCDQDQEEKVRLHAIQELIESERSYTNDMMAVRQVFEKPLSRSGLISREQMGQIFMNWREIMRGNHTLLRILEERKSSSPYGMLCVGDILSDNLPKMNCYVRFCSCLLNAGVLLQELTDNSASFRELCRQCQRDPRTQGLPLSTFLVKPMQRITKYPLLISKILEHTSVDHPDRVLLEEALYRAEQLCLQVNEGVREKENAERLEWLQSHILLEGLSEQLVFNSLTNDCHPRKFLYHSMLTKHRSGRELVAFLLTDFLVFAQPLRPLPNHHINLDRNSRLMFKLYKKPLLLSELTVQKSSELGEKVFTLTIPKGQQVVVASTVKELNDWIKHLNTAIQNHSSKPKVHCKAPKKFNGPAAGRLLVEVVEGFNLGAKQISCEVRVGSQVNYTESVSAPHKWNSSMQFLVKDLSIDVLSVCLFVRNLYAPDDMLDRSEIGIKEIAEQTQSTGPVLRKLSLKQFSNGKIHLKLDLQRFS